MHWGRVVLAGLFVVPWGACADPEPRPVSEAEARQVLDTAVGLGIRGEDDRLCAMALANEACREDVRRERHLRPTDPPRVLGTRVIESKGDKKGGTVVELEGVDGTGKPYRGDFLVFHDGERFVALVPVWWSGVTIG